MSVPTKYEIMQEIALRNQKPKEPIRSFESMKEQALCAEKIRDDLFRSTTESSPTENSITVDITKKPSTGITLKIAKVFGLLVAATIMILIIYAIIMLIEKEHPDSKGIRLSLQIFVGGFFSAIALWIEFQIYKNMKPF